MVAFISIIGNLLTITIVKKNQVIYLAVKQFYIQYEEKGNSFQKDSTENLARR